MRPARAEEDAVGDDDGRTAARLEEPQEEREEEQLSLPGLDDREQVLRRALVVEAAGERRIGKDERVR